MEDSVAAQRSLLYMSVFTFPSKYVYIAGYICNNINLQIQTNLAYVLKISILSVG